MEEKLDQHDDRAWSMWHLAYLLAHKFKKFPDLALFQSKRDKSGPDGKKPVDGINEDAIMAWLSTAKMNHDTKKAKK